MWAPVGKQPEIPAPGQNEKKVVYGGVDYATGKITYTIADSKSGMNFLIFLVALVKSYAGRKVRLVCDNGRFHHARDPGMAQGQFRSYHDLLAASVQPESESDRATVGPPETNCPGKRLMAHPTKAYFVS